MPRRMTPSQYNSMIRQAQSKHRQAVNKYNQEIKRVNREIDKHNSAVKRQHQEQKRAIDNYNREARAHNARVRANRQRYNSAISKVNNALRSSSTSRYVTSARSLNTSYTKLETRSDQGEFGEHFNEVLDFAENEAANSAELSNLMATTGEDTIAPDNTEFTPNEELLNKLKTIDDDFPGRWSGGLFALNPKNPDAARHFCTSAREIFTRIFHIKAPDTLVLEKHPDCHKTDQGSPTRRAKIDFLLAKADMSDNSLAEFIDTDVDNVLSLFHVLNEGTHGSVGTFSLEKLSLIKKRSEDGLLFLCKALAI